MKLLTAVSAAALVASTLVIGVTQLRQAAAAGSPTPPYFSCAAGALCVEPLQFRSALPEISNQDNTETRTSTVYNNTDGPVTITGSKFLNGSTQTFLFDAGPNDTCVGHTLRPGDECGFQVTDFAADPVTVTFEVDGTAGGAAVTGTAVIQSNRPIRPDNDLYTENFGASFEVDHVGARSGPQTITLTGYGAVPPPPVHVHLALDGPTALASGTPPSYYDHRWYRVTGANVVDDRPPGFPAEYEINRSDCIGKSVNKEADSIEEGSPSCKVSVTATPHSDGSHEATLDITYCTVEGSTENDCTDAAPRHVLAPLETTVPWNPGPCNTLCVEPLSFLPVNSDSGATYDPVLVRTSTVYNGTAWPLTVTADTFQNADGVFDINPLDTCLGKTIPPGGECGVSVRLHDDGQPHLRTALVVTATRDATCRPPSSGGPSCTVIGIGSITSRPTDADRDQDMWADPTTLDVGSAIVGTTTAPKTVTLAGWAYIFGEGPHPEWDRVMSVQVLGAQAADFKADSSDCVNKNVNIDAGTTDPFDGFTFAGVPSCKLSITATPSGTGMRAAYLDVTYCTVDQNEDHTPQADCFDSKTPRHVLVALTALGLAKPPPTGCHALCVEPLDFLPLPPGTDPTTIRTSAVFNGTGLPVTVTAESFLNGANRFDVFPTQSCIGHTLPAGGECAVSVRYTDDGAVHPQAALKVDGFHPPGGAPVTGQGAITVRTARQPDNDLYAVPSVLDFGNQPVGKRSAPLSVTLTGWGDTARGHLWYHVIGVSVFGDTGTAQPGDYQADGSDCAGKALNLKADPAAGFPGTHSCAITVTELPPSPGIRPAALDITYCMVTVPSAPCDGTTTPGHVLVGLTANGTRPTLHPKLTASPAVSPAGRVVHITGTGFPADAAFVLALTPVGTPAITDPVVLGKQLMKAGGRTDASGSLAADLLIMPNTVVGTDPLQAVATDVFGNQGAAQLGFLVVPGTQQIVPGNPPTVLPRH